MAGSYFAAIVDATVAAAVTAAVTTAVAAASTAAVTAAVTIAIAAESAAVLPPQLLLAWLVLRDPECSLEALIVPKKC